MGRWPQLESFYFNNLIDPNSLVHKLSDYDILNHILCWIADFLMDRIASLSGVTSQPASLGGES